MLGVCLIGLFAFVALAVDLGMLAVSRTQCQNAADVAALVGTRTLNNKDGVLYNNLPAAMTAATTETTSNPHLSAYLTSTQLSKIEAGQYLYDTTSQTFQVTTWTDVTNSGGTVSPSSGSWTAMRITLSVAQPTYFMRVFGVTTMPSGARATAVYRPRDIAFVLDMTGSMKYSSTFNTSNTTSTLNYQSLNPDTLVPTVGHYNSINGNQSFIIATQNLTDSSGQAFPRNNYCISTPGGPPLIRGFYFDPSNVSTPANVAYPLTTKADGSPNLINAFHRWSPPESGGDSTNYIGVTYDFTGYNAFNNGTESTPMGPTPAPDTFGTMTDSSKATYVGDRWRRRTGAIDKTTTDWTVGNNQAAWHDADLLGYSSVPTAPSGSTPSSFTTDWLNFRDAVWEQYGYDLDIAKYRTQRTTAGGSPMNPATFLANNGNSPNNILLSTSDRFYGYSMGPGYWGKTFYIWPPDPRFDTTANVLSPDSSRPGFDTSGKQICDWRRHFFFNKSGGALDPQADNNSTNTAGTVDPVNPVILNTGASGMTITATSGTQVNYAAILKWIKTGPQTLPPNLRAGRVLYYSSIPDDVNTATGTAAQQLDKAFWKNYIDFVLGIGNYTSAGNLYGAADSWSSAPQSISASTMNTFKYSWEASGKLPYMRYIDSPRRPRLHMWFGPLSMSNFLTQVNGTTYNWNAGTVYEAHSWQLKAGMNSVISDVKSNHPNDYAGLVFFSSVHNGVRVGLSQNYLALKNALFYPRSLYPQVNTGTDVTSELRPYTNTSLTGYSTSDIPNAGGSTDPDTGLMYAFNLLSPSSVSAATALGTGAGRRGAQKIIIFETDGVPNSYSAVTFNKMGYNSYYAPGSFTSASNGDATSMSDAYSVIQQIVKPMATTATTSGTGADSGLSLGNAPARVYPIAFGDLFDSNIAPNATFRPTAQQFLANCAYYGGTGPNGATSLPTDQTITGPYSQRISRLRDCLERIFQGGVSVALVE
jgi:hypothetical protein